MIQTIQMGEQNNDVLHLKFGTGDITMNHIEMDTEKFSLGFGVLPGRKVGETTTEFVGKTTDELPFKTQLVLSFDNPESVTALIHSLIELQKRIFDSKIS